MKTFTVRSNMMMLHATLSGLMLIHDMQPAEWIELNDKDVLAYGDAVDDYQLEVEPWYTKHWKLFPFGESNFRNLTLIQQEMVEQVSGQVNLAGHWYGENLQALPA
jgi:hypothetical protein